jgi:hypothetical protein
MNGDNTEPTSLEVELTAPTPIQYSTLRFRIAASRKPDESLFTLADRLTEQLISIANEQMKHVEERLSRAGRR